MLQLHLSELVEEKSCSKGLQHRQQPQSVGTDAAVVVLKWHPQDLNNSWTDACSTSYERRQGRSEEHRGQYEEVQKHGDH